VLLMSGAYADMALRHLAEGALIGGMFTMICTKRSLTLAIAEDRNLLMSTQCTRLALPLPVRPRP